MNMANGRPELKRTGAGNSDASDSPCWPEIDVAGLVEEQARTMQVCNKINSIALRGGQMLAQRQAVALQEVFDDLSSTLKSSFSPGYLRHIPEHQAELTEKLVRRNLEHVRVAIEVANDVNASLWESIQMRVSETFSNHKTDRP